jgi:hypothetical protein
MPTTPATSVASGTIAVATISDLAHEIRKAIHSAHRAHRKGVAYGPIALSDGVAKVTIEHAPEAPDLKSKSA